MKRYEKPSGESWTPENIVKALAGYTTVKAFRARYPDAYNAAHKKGHSDLLSDLKRARPHPSNVDPQFETADELAERAERVRRKIFAYLDAPTKADLFGLADAVDKIVRFRTKASFRRDYPHFARIADSDKDFSLNIAAGLLQDIWKTLK